MDSGDDVVTAVLGGTLLEEAVERTLKERMREDKDGAKRLFNLEKPLSPAAAQVNALYMLCKRTARILRLVTQLDFNYQL